MKKIIMVLLLFLLLMGCRNRRKTVEISQYKLAEVTKIDTNTVVSAEKQVQESEKITQKSDQKINSNDGDVLIKGRTDSSNAFTYHNVVAGDTLSDIYISGKADFVIKNRWRKVDKVEIKETEEEKINIVAQIARKSVAQSTIKDVAEKITDRKTSVKSTGFSLPVYVIIGGAVLLLILLWFGWKKLGGNIMERLNMKR